MLDPINLEFWQKNKGLDKIKDWSEAEDELWANFETAFMISATCTEYRNDFAEYKKHAGVSCSRKAH